MTDEYRSRTNWFMGSNDVVLPPIVKTVGNVERYIDCFDCEDFCEMNEGNVTYIAFNTKAKTNTSVLKAMVDNGWHRVKAKQLPMYYKYRNDID